jgi:hypothetical protein
MYRAPGALATPARAAWCGGLSPGGVRYSSSTRFQTSLSVEF